MDLEDAVKACKSELTEDLELMDKGVDISLHRTRHRWVLEAALIYFQQQEDLKEIKEITMRHNKAPGTAWSRIWHICDRAIK